MEFKKVAIIRPGSKDETRASYRLVTWNEARRHFLKILEDSYPEQEVRLKNGYLTAAGVESKYSPDITFKLVTPTSCSEEALTQEDCRIAMAYACENDDWQEVEELVKYAGRSILAARLPHEYQGTVLHVCSLFGSTETLEMLLKSEGIRPEELDSYGETPLHSAAFRGHVGAVKLILASPDSKKMLNVHNCYGNTPLIHSVRYGHAEVCKLLLGTGEILPDVGNNDGQTALHVAVANKDINIVNVILTHPMSECVLVNRRNGNGQTPLHLAASTGQEDICSRLLQNGASVVMKDNDNMTPVHLAQKDHKNVLKVLQRSFSNETLLILCAQSKDLINRKFEFGLTALHIAATRANADLTQVLIENGAFLDVRNDDGDTALHIAVRGGHSEVVERLLSLEEDKCNFSNKKTSRQQWLSTQNSVSGDTALHIAVRNSRNSNKMSLDLINSRAFVDVKNSIGETPLHIAAREGDFSVLLRLLSAGQCALSPGTDWNAWVSMCDFEGETALHEAVRKGDEDVVNALLRQPNADELLHIRDIYNRTALYWALQLPDAERMLEKLLENAQEKTRWFLLWNLGSALDKHPAIKEKLTSELPSDDESEQMRDLLRIASEIKDLEMATELISRGARVTELPKSARTWLSENLCEKPSDRPAPRDSLGRKPLVDGIAALLLSPFTGTPITLGIFGEWGMGKSSLMLQVEEALLEMAANETLRVLPPQFKSSRKEKALRSQVVKALYPMSGDTAVIEYRPEHRQLFKHLALTHRSTLVAKSASPADAATKDQSLREVRSIGQIPAVLTVSYNAWRYQDKAEASAGLAIEVSQEIENSMSPPQWLRMCWRYSWERQPKDIFVQLLLPLFIAALALLVVLILWKVAPIKTAYKALSLPVGVAGAALLLFRTSIGILQPVTQNILSYVQTPDHRATLGYQHKVIHDIQFLIDQLCEPPNIWWTILGFFGQWFTSNTSYYMQGTRVRKEAPPKDNLRIVVFIDDLDRCQQDIILELLCAINLILAACEINVVLGIDKTMVQQAVTKAFLKESDANADSAQVLADKYLRKIIQLPIQLPDLSGRDLTTFLEGQIGRRFAQSTGHNEAHKENQHEPSRNEDPSGVVLDTSDAEGNGNNELPCHMSLPVDEPTETSTHTGSSTEGVSAPFRLILANYSQSEAQMLRRLCGRAEGDRKFPREWKRFLNYHRLASNILLQDPAMKSDDLKGWRRKLILWIFVCWNWTQEMNIIIKTWDDLIFERQMGQGNEPGARDKSKEIARDEESSLEEFIAAHILAEEESLEEKPEFIEDVLSLGDVIGMHLEKLESSSHAVPEKRTWREFLKLLQEEGDLRMEFIQAFQQFRFYCELDHLEISLHTMKKKRKTMKKTMIII